MNVPVSNSSIFTVVGVRSFRDFPAQRCFPIVTQPRMIPVAAAQEDPHAGCAAPPVSVPDELLQRPVVLRSGAGNSREDVSSQSKSAAEFYNQGLNYLESFVWIEAARSFHQALRRRRINIREKQLDAIEHLADREKHAMYKKAIDDALALYVDDPQLWLLRGNAEEATAAKELQAARDFWRDADPDLPEMQVILRQSAVAASLQK